MRNFLVTVNPNNSFTITFDQPAILNGELLDYDIQITYVNVVIDDTVCTNLFKYVDSEIKNNKNFLFGLSIFSC